MVSCFTVLAARFDVVDSAVNTSKASVAKTAHARCALQSLALSPALRTGCQRDQRSLTARSLQCLRRLCRLRDCPFESRPTAPHRRKTIASLRSALRLPCSRSLRSRDRSLTPPQPRRPALISAGRLPRTRWLAAAKVGRSQARATAYW